MLSEEDYRERVKQLAEAGENKVIYNSDAKHAVILLSELIKRAKRYAHIVCENMDTEVTDKDEYCDAVEEFLKGNNKPKMKILLTDYSEKFMNTRIAKLLKKYSEQVEIKYLKDNAKIISGSEPINWAVFDDTSLRLEEDTKNKIAYGNFNNPNLAKKFNDKFEAIFADDRSLLVSL